MKALLDFSEIRGQEGAKRALEIAVAGGHHIFLLGPLGSGKTSLAGALLSIMPEPSEEEREEIARVYDLAGLPAPEGLPLRIPPTTVTAVAMTGRRRPVRPGEASLASGGILVLDEVHAFRRDALKALLAPIDYGYASFPGPGRPSVLPAMFTMVATGNLCPCGSRGHFRRACSCTPAAIRRHRKRIPAAIYDRCGLHAEVPALELAELRAGPGEKSDAVRERVAEARERQRRRSGVLNAHLDPQALREVASPDRAGRKLLEAAFRRLALSPRGHTLLLQVARTIADLAGSDEVRSPHVAEAIQYRALDRGAAPLDSAGSFGDTS